MNMNINEKHLFRICKMNVDCDADTLNYLEIFYEHNIYN